MNKHELFQTLKKSGWYEGRNIENKIKSSLLFKVFPQEIIDFYNEFGKLSLHADGHIETITVGITHLNNEKAYEYYLNNTYKIGNAIDFSKDDDWEYYYSTLIGEQLYFVANLVERASLMKDKLGNFYIINFLEELIWISNDTYDALYIILFGSPDWLIFDDSALRWLPPENKNLSYKPPINSKLAKNPWE